LKRAVRLVLVGVVLALLVAGCREETSDKSERLATSLQDVIDDDLTAGPAYSVLDAECDPRGGSLYRCTADIGVNPDAIQQVFDVRLGADDCWTATLVEVSRATGRSVEDDELPADTLNGCLQ
jgi:hypothetical protein